MFEASALRPTLVVLLAVAVVALACGTGSESPDEVTARFWEAIRDRDIETAAEQSLPSNPELLERLRDGRPIDEVLIGETLTGKQTAVVRTSLATRVNDRISHTSFETHLVRVDSHWRVDADATEQAFATALFATSMREIGEAVGQGVQEFSDALGQGAEDVRRAIQEAIEDLNQDLQ